MAQDPQHQDFDKGPTQAEWVAAEEERERIAAGESRADFDRKMLRRRSRNYANLAAARARRDQIALGLRECGLSSSPELERAEAQVGASEAWLTFTTTTITETQRLRREAASPARRPMPRVRIVRAGGRVRRGRARRTARRTVRRIARDGPGRQPGDEPEPAEPAGLTPDAGPTGAPS